MDENLIRTVMAFVSAKTWEDWSHMVRSEAAILLSTDADSLLGQMHEVAKHDPELAAIIELRRNLLRRCREDGIAATFAHLKGPIPDEGVAAEEVPEAPIPAEDPEVTIINRDAYKGLVLRSVLHSYDKMLEEQRDSPLDYGQTQLNRAKVLHQLAGLPDEDRPAMLYGALNAYNDALNVQKDVPRDYARTQGNRAVLLYQLAVLTGENHIERLREALDAYDDALDKLSDIPHVYGKTQLNRVALLRDIAGLPGEDRAARLYQALDGLEKALECHQDMPMAYAKTQIPRANLLRELAGLEGEDRPTRLREALQAYDDALANLEESAIEYAVTQTGRASLLQEIANLPGEDRAVQLQNALKAAAAALRGLQQHDNSAQYRAAQRMMANTRNAIVNHFDEATFREWWAKTSDAPLPDWL